MIYWNQKEVLFRKISNYIQEYKIKSILDIGAGDGLLALKLSEAVNNYTALENNKRNVEELSKYNINVREVDFPRFKTKEKYDLVVSSHSVPEDLHKVEKFILKAWELVSSGGLLLLVTFKGSEGDIFKLKSKLGDMVEVLDKEIFEKIIEIFKKLGDYQISKEISTIKANSLDELVEAISFSLGCENNPSKKTEIEKLIEKEFKTNHGYRFNYEHIFISLKK